MNKQRKPLKPREIKFVEAKVKGKTNRQAAMEATGASLEVAAVQANRMLKDVNVQEELQKAFERHGITIDKAIKPISDGLEAEKVHIVGNGEEAMAEIVPDHSIRLKASSMATQLMGLGKQTEGTNQTFIFIAAKDKDEFGI